MYASCQKNHNFTFQGKILHLKKKQFHLTKLIGNYKLIGSYIKKSENIYKKRNMSHSQ